jgi:hypothetical protein
MTDVMRHSLPYCISKNADSLNFRFDQIARQAIACSGNQSSSGLPTSSKLMIGRPSGPSWRPGDDDHTRLQGEVRGEEVNEIGTSPNHVSSIAELTQLAIYFRADIEYLRIWNLIGRNDPRPSGALVSKAFPRPSSYHVKSPKRRT